MSQSCCQTDLNVEEIIGQQRRVLTWVLLINVVAFLVMVVGSYLSNSSSLLSGTLDNLGDALTYALSLAVVGASRAAKARVALFKGILIFCAAMGVAAHIGMSILNPATPIIETMGIAAILNLAANLVCLRLLYPFRNSDVNMASVWECSKNDIFEGVAVIAATGLVWFFEAAWPDLLIAIALLVLFLRSSFRVITNARQEQKSLKLSS